MSGVGRRARDLAAEIASGTLGAVDVVRAHLDHIDAHEADIRAFNTLVADRALEEAAALDADVAAGRPVGPLAGVPVALKDNLVTKGVATTCSSRMLQGWIPPYDATVVDRLREAGAIVVGKTNLDEFAMGSSTETSFFGPTRNPIDLTRTPGGSSGGSAAAVAAGFAPLALGSDTGGSIRQPAAYCGVVGVKPRYGRVSRYGLVAFASSLDHVGPLAVDVADAALLLDVISGPDPADSTCLPDVPEAISPHLDDGVAGLRVGLLTELLGDEIDPAITTRVREAAEALARAGAEIVEVSIPAVAHGISAYHLIAPAEASSNLARFDGVRFGLRVDAPTTAEMMTETRTAGFGDEVKLRIMLGTWALSAGRHDELYGTAQRARTLLIREFDAAYQQVDVLLAPTTPAPAFAAGSIHDPLTMYLKDLCTIPANLTGDPAISVPYGTVSGLPVGIQVVAPKEIDVFRTAMSLEAAAPDRAVAATLAKGGAPA